MQKKAMLPENQGTGTCHRRKNMPMDGDKMARPSAGRGEKDTLSKKRSSREVELEKENAQLREEARDLKKAAAFLPKSATEVSVHAGT